MPRKARTTRGNTCYHVLNRGNERRTIFHSEQEYASFVQLLARARNRQQMRVLAFCLMPNHFHLCLWPFADGDLGRFMHWLTTAHVSQFRKNHPGTGHVWQGRFKAFAAQDGAHLWRVIRYIERNAVRAGLCARPKDWQWCSAAPKSLIELSEAPTQRPQDWQAFLSRAETDTDLAELRAAANLERPLGDASWLEAFSEQV